jgi:UPF0176 protein
MKHYLIAAFYKFISLNELDSLKPVLLEKMAALHIKGTIILALEGINGTISGNSESIDGFFNSLTETAIGQVDYKSSYDDEIPFDKAKVKIRNEIVTLGVENANPALCTGQHVAPADWNNLISDPEVLVVDTRNEYEVSLGTFKNAINPNTLNFRDFPQYVSENLLDKKDKKIAMFCTGGIRCEKSTAYLLGLGFEQVYQLDGGILSYLESIPPEESLWEGSCFIFDDRLALDPKLQRLEKGTLESDWKHKKRQAFIDKQLSSSS